MTSVGEPGLETSAAPEPSIETRTRRTAAVAFVRGAALLPVLVVLFVVGTLVSPAFLTSSNLWGVGQQISSLGVLTVGEALIIMIGGMDLSLESTYGFAPTIGAWLILPKTDFGLGTVWSPYIGILIVLAIGAAIGMFNGVCIVKGRLNGFIFTLAMTIILAGFQTGVVSGNPLYNFPTAFSYIGGSFIGAVPVSLIITAVIFVVVGLVLRYHRIGREIYAVGGNPAAARAAGIRVNRVKIGTYVVGGTLAALGGLMEAGRASALNGTQGYGEGIIFEVFAAAVIGGVSLRGGRGNMLGAASGVVLLGIVSNILDLDNVNNYWVLAIYGCVILIALVLARVVGGEATAE